MSDELLSAAQIHEGPRLQIHWNFRRLYNSYMNLEKFSKVFSLPGTDDIFVTMSMLNGPYYWERFTRRMGRHIFFLDWGRFR